MKKVITISLLALLPILIISSCSDEDDPKDNKELLIGSWIEETTSTYEVFNLTFYKNGTGEVYATFDGVMDDLGISKFVWEANESTVDFRYENGETAKEIYSFKNDRLYLGDLVYKRK